MIALRDVAEIVLITAVAGAVSGGAGIVALRAVRRRSVTASVVVVALVSMLAVAGGVAGTAAAMFLSAHDLGVLLAVVAVASAVGVGCALWLSRALMAGSRALGLAARRLAVEEASQPDRDGVPLSRELASVSAELATTAARLAEARASERAMEASRRDLIAWMSHDLRTPLAGVRAMAEALEDRVVEDPGSVASYHTRIREEADRMSAMVDDLFELSRIHSGTLRLSLQRVSLADLVSDALASADPLASAKGVRLAGRAEPAPVEVGVPELGRVLRNLLVNAIRHTPSDGSVEVVGSTDGASAYVAVADGCGGIPPDDLGRLFEVAFRGTAARTPDPHGGAGLGLAIARGLVEAHGGQLTVDNAGAGCRFTVRLPALAR